MDRRILYSQKCCKYAALVILSLFAAGMKLYANSGDVGDLYSNVLRKSNKIMEGNVNYKTYTQHKKGQSMSSDLQEKNSYNEDTYNNGELNGSQLSAGEKFQKMFHLGQKGMSKGANIMSDVNRHMMVFEEEMRNAVHDYSKAKTPAERSVIQGRIDKVKDDLYYYNSRVQQKLIEIQQKQAQNLDKLRKAASRGKQYANPYNPYDNGSGLVNPYRQ